MERRESPGFRFPLSDVGSFRLDGLVWSSLLLDFTCGVDGDSESESESSSQATSSSSSVDTPGQKVSEYPYNLEQRIVSYEPTFQKLLPLLLFRLNHQT